MPSNATTLKNALKDGMPTVYVQEVEGIPWIGTAYFATTFGEGARTLLAKFNLDATPASLTVNGTVTKNTDRAVPRLTEIVALPTETVELSRVHLAGKPVLLDAGVEVALYERPDGTHVGVNRKFLAAILAEIGADEGNVTVTQLATKMVRDYKVWHRQGTPEPMRDNAHNTPVHLTGSRGRAVLMPVRL